MSTCAYDGRPCSLNSSTGSRARLGGRSTRLSYAFAPAVRACVRPCVLSEYFIYCRRVCFGVEEPACHPVPQGGSMRIREGLRRAQIRENEMENFDRSIDRVAEKGEKKRRSDHGMNASRYVLLMALTERTTNNSPRR